MKTNSEKRVNRYVRKINKELATSPYPEYIVRQDCKQRQDNIIYYLFKVYNKKYNSIEFLPIWYTEFDICKMNKLVIDVNKIIGEQQINNKEVD